MEISFVNPDYLYLLGVLPILVVIHFISIKYVKRRALRLANFEAIKRVIGEQIVSKNFGLLFVRFVVLLFLIMGLAEMTLWYKGDAVTSNYVIAIDASGSMLADDFQPNRLSAAKEASIIFLSQLKTKTKVGVISFSGIAYVENRMTESFSDVKTSINEIEIKSVHGTALGEALKGSANMLLNEQKASSIILLTDGRENVASETELEKVINYVKENHIVVNTIGIGTVAGGVLPETGMVSTLDEDTLKNIAEETGGKYFRVEDRQQMEEAFSNIIETGVDNIPIRLKGPLLTIVFLLLIVEWILANTKYRAIP